MVYVSCSDFVVYLAFSEIMTDDDLDITECAYLFILLLSHRTVI